MTREKTLRFIPRGMTIVDEDGLVHANLEQIPLKISDLMDVIESFLYIASSTSPLPKKYEGKIYNSLVNALVSVS